MHSIIKPLFLLLAGLLIFTGCTKDFDEINLNPNAPETVNPDLLLPTIMRNPIYTAVGMSWGEGNVVGQYTAKIQFTTYDRYDWSPTGTPWNAYYSAMRDINNVINIAADPTQAGYRGVALIMKSWMYALMTDLYGELPYSQAIKGKEGEYFPRYDTQEAIYDGIFADLETANQLLADPNTSGIGGDILFNGNKMRWRRFANSLALRYATRISLRRNPAALMNRILGDPATYPVFESNAQQAALTFLPDLPNQQDLYTTRSGSFDEYRLSEQFEDLLKDINDTRIFLFAQPTSDARDNSGLSYAEVAADMANYEGVPNGLDDAEALSYAPSGNPSKGGSNFISRAGLLWTCSACDPKASPNAAQAVLMSYSELQFILAEAAEKGWISGDAEAYYLAGIQASFDYYLSRVPGNFGIDLSTVGATSEYLAQPGVAYAGTQAEKLEKIGIQKYITLYFTDMQGWIEYRRTGFPRTITPGQANQNEGRVPVRYLYPIEQQVLNLDSYNEAVGRQGADDINTRVWWDVD